jgi:SAM-dependent methyltransferase
MKIGYFRQMLHRLTGAGRWAVFPGLDLHTRNRASLSRFWMRTPRDVLDAGSGNGYFAWLAYKSGGRVVALNRDARQVSRARELFLASKRARPDDLKFEEADLRSLGTEVREFDEIICFEVLEHLRDDAGVVREFYRVLRSGGRLHLCCPFRDHPRHQAEILDVEETGGHVRAGYTAETFRALLEAAGFRIERTVGIGPPSLYHMDRLLRSIRNRAGDWLALPLLLPALLVVRLAEFNPRVPFSLYVTAVKP